MELTQLKKWMLLLALVCGIGASGQVFAVIFNVTMPPSANPALLIEPGQSVAFQFDVQNINSDSGIAEVPAFYFESGAFNNEYSFSSGQPAACAAPVMSVSSGGSYQVTFPVTLAASQLLRCTYQLTRSSGSINDIRLAFGPSGASFVYFAGTLPDLGIAGEIAQVPYGATEAVVRISQRNPSPREVAAHLVGTSCAIFAPLNPPPAVPFLIEDGFPGACQSLTRATCGVAFGLSGANWRFTLGPIPANGEASCLLRLRFPEPLTSLAQLSVMNGALYTSFSTVQFTDGGTGFDVQVSNNEATFGASPAPQPVPTNGWMGLLSLWSIVIVAAMVALRRRRSPQRR